MCKAATKNKDVEGEGKDTVKKSMYKNEMTLLYQGYCRANEFINRESCSYFI